MSIRNEYIEKATNRIKIDIQRPSNKVSDYFASNVFTTETMRKYLSEEAFYSVMSSIERGTKIDRKIADQVASAMKSWAISKGATHHTHWFQPLTGLTAEKHDAFFSLVDSSKGIESFSGDALVQGEPDGSSFPSGGMRNTHEARGYTAWDPSSPAFIMENGTHGKTLCVPTIFISYTGQTMDYKGPLLKSIQFLEKAAVDVCHYFDRNVKRVVPTLGWEQEFFLIDKTMYNARPDLVATGRTLVGNIPAKGQQLEDHYFGSIPERVQDFMLDLETEAWKLGIPLKTRHNEVAPGQYEFAPRFEEANKAVDQNQLFMDLMDRVARRHDLRVLLHEKPFANVNGSGKHNNWSLGTDTHINLLSPGSTPRTNLQFLTFFINTIKAVHDHANLMRASVASAGNDHRLGANEAPPAIISVFIGTTLYDVLDEIERSVKKGEKMDEYEKADLKLNIHNKIPDLLLDNTDRNRTSPFAFTGNKFEFRAVGSSFNCSFPMTVLNTIVANQLSRFKQEVDKLVEGGEKKDGAILRVLRRYITDAKKILFEGDNYSKEWEEEAQKRGLSNVKTTPYALDFLVGDDAKEIFVDNHIFSHTELEARYEVLNEQYQRKIQIESRILGEMVMNQIIPSATHYLHHLTSLQKNLYDISLDKETTVFIDLIKEIITYTNQLKKEVDNMIEARRKANKIEATSARAKAYCDKVKPHLEKIRDIADRLEFVVEDAQWTLPKYREMLFIR
ncbi:MAG: glutamine synthetase III [Chitinophagales bacterium]|nr:glutamine synthetase III [Bacteroidota bacterium]MCB9043460.1 glutamine synthetase III [Chitinophagales bacterium]